MKQHHTKLIFLWVTITMVSLLFSACRAKTPEIDINAEKTGFAQTAMVQATMTAQSQPTTTPTQQPSPTETGLPETTATSTLAAVQTATTTAPVSGTDQAAWLANDPPDNTEFSPGEEFTITWTLENIGTSTWTTGYYINFASGEQMGAGEKVTLPYDVSPGTNVKISANLIAPEEEGDKQSIWRLYNPNDLSFYEFYILIKVKNPAGD